MPLENAGAESNPTQNPAPLVQTGKRGAVRGKPRAPTRMPDLVSIRAVLDYCPDTGVFTWSKDVNRRSKGSVAGGRDQTGYWIIGVNRQQYKAHRLAWLLHYGTNPEGEIDHLNLIKTDNRIANLRDASRFGNQQNFPKLSTNTSGYKGAHFDKQSKRWRGTIQANGKRHHLGWFPDAETAGKAYDEASRRLHGTFARPNQQF